MIVLKVALLMLPTFVARVLSPSIVLLTTFSLFFSHPQTFRSSSPITPVVVANDVPRRALILTLLSLVALTYLLDGLFFVVYAVLDNDWPRHSGIPINTVTGLVAFSGLAALGAWKEVQGVEVWLLRRVKVAIAAGLALDISLAVMLALHIRHGPSCELPNNSNLTPYLSIYLSVPRFSIHALIHVVFPAFRALLLLPLLVGLISPRVTYSSVRIGDDVESPEATASTFLLPPTVAHSSTGLSVTSGLNGESSKYGTFHTTRSNLQGSVPATRATTPAPSTGPDTKVRFILQFSFMTLKVSFVV